MLATELKAGELKIRRADLILGDRRYRIYGSEWPTKVGGHIRFTLNLDLAQQVNHLSVQAAAHRAQVVVVAPLTLDFVRGEPSPYRVVRVEQSVGRAVGSDWLICPSGPRRPRAVSDRQPRTNIQG